MIEMRGPSNSYIFFDDETLDHPRHSPLFFCDAQTLGEALEKYCQEFGSSIRPYATDPPAPPFADGMRMALVYDDPNSRFRDVVVVVSIDRGGQWLAGPYGLDCLLLPGDKISFGVAGC